MARVALEQTPADGESFMDALLRWSRVELRLSKWQRRHELPI